MSKLGFTSEQNRIQAYRDNIHEYQALLTENFDTLNALDDRAEYDQEIASECQKIRRENDYINDRIAFYIRELKAMGVKVV